MGFGIENVWLVSSLVHFKSMDHINISCPTRLSEDHCSCCSVCRVLPQTVKTVPQIVPYPEPRYLDHDVWTRISGPGCLDQDVWTRISGPGYLDQDIWSLAIVAHLAPNQLRLFQRSVEAKTFHAAKGSAYIS